MQDYLAEARLAWLPGGLRALVASRRHLLAALLAIASVQLAYWWIIKPQLFTAPSQFERFEPVDPGMAQLSAPTLDALGKARFRPVTLPAFDCCGPGYRALAFDLVLPEVPEAGLGVIPQASGDNIWIAVNGQWAHRPGRIALPDITYHGNVKRVFPVPAAMLRQGSNQVAFVLVRDGGVPWFDFTQPMIGRLDEVARATGHASFMRNEYKTISATMAGILAAMAFAAAFAARYSRYALWVGVLLGAWGLRSAYYQWTDPPFAGEWRLAYYFALTILVPVAYVQAANEWTGRPWRWLRWLGYGALAGLFGFVAWQLGRPAPGGYDMAGMVLDIAGMALGGLALVRFMAHIATDIATGRDRRHWETALLVLGVTVSIIEFARFYLGTTMSDNLETVLPLLALGMAVAFFERNFTLFRSSEQLRGLLSAQLAEREAELTVQYARQEELARRETLVGERQRLMRDMHDGIGGQLMSLLFAARQKALGPDDLTQGLQATIDELRLIIDSLDTVGESLGSALASFRARIEPRLNAAGITIDWSNTLPDDLPELPPRTTLQVFRIVQEAITNAIKHSGARSLAVSIGLSDQSDAAIGITIADSGSGFDQRLAVGGRGLSSMEARAAAIGGRLVITSGAQGTSVVLVLPLPAQGSA